MRLHVNVARLPPPPASDADAGFGRCDAYSSGPGTGAAGVSDVPQPAERGAAGAASAEGADGEREAAGSAQSSRLGARGRALPIAAHAGRETGLTFIRLQHCVLNMSHALPRGYCKRIIQYII